MKTVIFDIDGTLADVSHRRHHLDSQPKRWDLFFAEMDKDPPNKDVVALCQWALAVPNDLLNVVFCSGRGEEHREVTETWLKKHVYPGFGVVCNLPSLSKMTRTLDLRMRPAKDNRPDDIIKKEMLDVLRAEGHDIWFVVDDRQRVVDMWRANGVTVLQCAPGDFDNAAPWEYTPKDDEVLLTLMVGPSGAGKSTYAEALRYARALDREAVISSDKVRELMCGDFKDQSQNARVFGYVHDLAKTRLRYGLRTIIDATHLHRRDRLASVSLAPKGTKVEYVVVDRPLQDKLRDGGWRLEVVKDGQNLIERHHKSFQSSKSDIFNGDGLPNVIVTNQISH